MLTKLTVENYALIDHLEMSLDGALNIITGETGAGKSILLGALGLLMGGKNDSSATKDNTKNCVIEGEFSISKLGLEPLFEQKDWEYEEQITIRRIITTGGKSRSFVGDIPVSLSDLKELTLRLIDIHSQHQNQILGDERFRIRAIDLLYDSKEITEEYRTKFGQLIRLRSELREVEEIAASARRDEEWLTHQVEELTLAKLRSGEEAEAEAELQILENAEAICEALTTLTSRLDSDDERSILIDLRASERELRSVAKSYPAAGEYAERLGSVIAELKDLNISAVNDSESVESDPERQERLSSRIDQLYSLCQKHRANGVDELIEIHKRYTEQLLAIQNSDGRINNLKKSIAECEKSLSSTAKKISKSRREAAPHFERQICTTLHRLGMEQARFSVSITPLAELSSTGGDRIEFLFSSVEGKCLQGVDKIASGGEISRVMLALKGILAERMELPTVIFDEIDTGVSGRIAEAMGEIIAELSGKMQVIDITHLPQVASKGASHFVVFKADGRTNIAKLTDCERVDHIATMISGSSVTEAAIAQARILLGV
ncbi:MAG: DNA repair protein RecN [Rikenellaceae bacterium]